jgi:uncharacterized membrane protein YfcA
LPGYDHLPWIGLVLSLGAVIQGAVGFGLGLFAIPLLIWCGLSLPEAIGAVLSAVSLQTGLNCWQHRGELPLSDVWPMFGLRVAGLPLGLAVLLHVDQSQAAFARQFVGGFLLVVLALQWALHPIPRPSLPAAWTCLAGLTSGLCAGMVGMGGPPISLWVLAHDWPPIRQRSFLWLSFLLIIPLHATLLVARFGEPLLAAVATGALLSPATLVGAWVGGLLGGRLNRRRLRQVMFAILLLIALRSLLTS